MYSLVRKRARRLISSIFWTLAITGSLESLLLAQVREPMCVRLNTEKPAQIVSLVKQFSVTHLLLEFRNNTSCNIIIETDDSYTGALVKNSDGILVIQKEPTDDIRVPLHYLTQNSRQQRLAQPGYKWGDSVATFTVNKGMAVMFIVPNKHFRKKLDIIVPFHYEWDAPVAVNTDGGVRNYSYLLFADLPPSTAILLK